MKGNLLIVDDEELLLMKLKEILSDCADEVFTAINGEEGYKSFKANTVHCIVCDINMPISTGVDLIKKIRADQSDVPFIFFTAHGNEALMLEAAKYGAFDFIDKPNIEGLEEVVVNGLKQGISETSHSDEGQDSHISEYKKLLKKV